MLKISTACTLLILALFTSLALAENATIPGEASSPYPTVENLAVEWEIGGDDNENGVVTVRYRPAGGEWKTGLPLVRVPAGSNMADSWTNKHAGSVFGLAEGTNYEVELTLKDPDGGAAQKILKSATRKVPTAAPDSRIVRVTPQNVAAATAVAQPGDILLLEPGDYEIVTVDKDGTPEKPIVISAATAHTANLRGLAIGNGRSHIIAERLNVGSQGIRFPNGKFIAIIGCKVCNEGHGISGADIGNENCYIADNIVIDARLVSAEGKWSETVVSSKGKNYGEGIYVRGPGHVICYNKVFGYRDSISTVEKANARQKCIDIHGNDLDCAGDDAIEADFTSGNVRIYNNRITNCWTAVSCQPTLGGPTFVHRNLLYNVIRQTFKLKVNSIGDQVYHNTVIKSGDGLHNVGDSEAQWFDRAVFRNNIFIGGSGGSTYRTYDTGAGWVLNASMAKENCSFDFNGYGTVNYSRIEGIVGKTKFSSIQEMREKGIDKNAVEVSLSVFADPIAFPDPPFPARAIPASLMLKAGSAAVDRGIILPNINDGFSGAAPDLGAFEIGAKLPHYGPRLHRK